MNNTAHLSARFQQWRNPILLLAPVVSLWLLSSMPTLAQSIPEGTERIDIKTDLSDSLLFERIVTLLQADGYSGNFRAERSQITTDSRSIDMPNWKARIVAKIVDSTVQLRTEGNNQSVSPPAAAVVLTHTGKADEAAKVGFGRLNAFAKQLVSSIPGSSLTYYKSP